MASQGKQMQGLTGSIYTRRKQKQGAHKDGGGKQMKRRAVFGSVTDLAHGRQAQPGCLPQLTVPCPATKREKYHLGSPYHD